MIISEQFALLPNNIRLHYASKGEQGKPLLLFLHGFPEAWFAWQAQLEKFGGEFFAVAPDLRGYNLSSKPVGVDQYRPKLLMQDVALFIEHLGYEKACIVAHDWGGAVAWNLAIMQPQSVEKLIIINSPHPYLFMRELRKNPAQQRASAYMNWLRQEGSENALSKDNFKLLENFFQSSDGRKPGWYTPQLQALYHAAWNIPGQQQSHALSGGINYYRASPLHPPLKDEPKSEAIELKPEDWQVQVPTCVIWGEQDMALLIDLLRDLNTVVQNLNIKPIPEGTHWVVHEYPQLVNEYIQQYLTQIAL